MAIAVSFTTILLFGPIRWIIMHKKLVGAKEELPRRQWTEIEKKNISQEMDRKPILDAWGNEELHLLLLLSCRKSNVKKEAENGLTIISMSAAAGSTALLKALWTFTISACTVVFSGQTSVHTPKHACTTAHTHQTAMCKQQIKDTMSVDIYSGGLRYDSQTSWFNCSEMAQHNKGSTDTGLS